MANELRLLTNFLGGLIDDDPLAAAATTFNSPGLAAMPVIDTTNYMPIVLDPDGIEGPPEIVWVIAHASGATSATILRTQEGSTNGAHSRYTPWVHSVSALDFNERPLWRLRLNESGASFANWTADNGTWASNGTLIQQTATTPSSLRAHYTAKLPGHAIVFQSDIRLNDNGGDVYGGLILGGPAGANGGALVRVQRSGGTWAVQLERDSQLALGSEPWAGGDFNWHTLRGVRIGNLLSVYIDGVWLASSVIAPAEGRWDTVSLWTNSAAVDFRNIKLWTLEGMPA